MAGVVVATGGDDKNGRKGKGARVCENGSRERVCEVHDPRAGHNNKRARCGRVRAAGCAATSRRPPGFDTTVALAHVSIVLHSRVPLRRAAFATRRFGLGGDTHVSRSPTRYSRDANIVRRKTFAFARRRAKIRKRQKTKNAVEVGRTTQAHAP